MRTGNSWHGMYRALVVEHARIKCSLSAGAERVHRWWSLGDTSAHVQGAQMMGKPSVSFRKARFSLLACMVGVLVYAGCSSTFGVSE